MNSNNYVLLSIINHPLFFSSKQAIEYTTNNVVERVSPSSIDKELGFPVFNNNLVNVDNEQVWLLELDSALTESSPLELEEEHFIDKGDFNSTYCRMIFF